MERDMDIIRALLISAEKENKDGLDKYSAEQLSYHAQLLIEAGLIEGTVIWAPSMGMKKPVRYFIERVTWNGHEFLSASRDNRVWALAKEHILKPGASWSVNLLLEYLKAEAARLLKLTE